MTNSPRMYNVCMCVVSQEVCMAAAPRTDEAGCVRGGRVGSKHASSIMCYAFSRQLHSVLFPGERAREIHACPPALPSLSLSLFLILPLSCWDWLVLWKGYVRKELCQLDATSRGELLEASQGYTAQSEGPCVISFLVTHLDAGKECCAQWGRESWL